MHSTLSIRRTLLVAATLILALGSAPSALVAQLLPEQAVILQEGPVPPFGPPGGGGRFGNALVIADFNGDGVDDLAASQRLGEGRVYVFHGGAGGPVYSQTLTQFGVNEMGAALASCDLNEDGYADLAVSATTTTLNGVGSAGVVTIYLGSEGGLNPVQTFHQGDLGLTPGNNERFGEVLAAGDFDGDQSCDLAIQTPGEDFPIGRGDASIDSGLVTIVYGSGNGQLATATALHLDHYALNLVPRDFEKLGGSLLAIPPDLDAQFALEDELLIGIPEKDLAGHDRLGQIVKVRFDGRAVAAAQAIDPTPLLVDGVDYDHSEFGAALGFGEFFGQEQLLISAPGLFTGFGEGIVLLVPRATMSDPTTWFGVWQEQVGLTGSFHEDFGVGLAVGDFDHDGLDDLAVGTPRDTEVAGTRGVSTYGSVLVYYGGATLVARHQYFLEPDLGNPQLATSYFGQEVAAGDLFGRGTHGLVIAAPRRDGPQTRGDAPWESNGTVYAMPARSQARDASLLARTGVAHAGDSRVVTALSSASSNAVGGFGFRGQFEDGETFVVLDGEIVYRDSDLPEPLLSIGMERGFVRAGASAHAHLDESTARGLAGPFDVVVTQDGVVVREWQELPPAGTGVLVGRPGALQTTLDERLYFEATYGFERRIVRTAPGFSTPLERLLEPGDPFDGVFVLSLDSYAVSPSATHRTFSGLIGNIAQQQVLALDDHRVSSNTSFFGEEGIGYFGASTIADDGRFAFFGQLSGGGDRVYGGAVDTSGFTVESRFDPSSVNHRLGVPAGVSLAHGSLLHLWSNVLNRSGQGPGSSAQRGGLLGPNETLLEACGRGLEQSIVTLRSGDALRLNGAPVVDTEVVRIYPVDSPAGIQPTVNDSVYLRVGLRRGAEEFDAIIELPLSGAMFCDGFESGGVVLWSTTLP